MNCFRCSFTERSGKSLLVKFGRNDFACKYLATISFPGFFMAGSKINVNEHISTRRRHTKNKNVVGPVTVICTRDNENTMNITMKMNEKKLHTPIHVPRKPL